MLLPKLDIGPTHGSSMAEAGRHYPSRLVLSPVAMVPGGVSGLIAPRAKHFLIPVGGTSFRMFRGDLLH